MSFSKPRQNLVMPHAVQKRIDAMFAGETGFSGPEIIEYFSRLDQNVEQYKWDGGMPSRKQMLQDCLSGFPKEQQLEILTDMVRPENFHKYSPPAKEDREFLLTWISEQRSGLGAPSLQFPIHRSSANAPQSPESGWDVFISHASEDKETIARPLADQLREKGLRVWFDAFTLTVGDSLRRSIDKGLAQSRFGIVILSEAFFQKQWPQLELDGLVARETAGLKIILPIWHDLDVQRVRMFSPLLADRLAVSTSIGLDAAVAQLLRAIERQ